MRVKYLFCHSLVKQVTSKCKYLLQSTMYIVIVCNYWHESLMLFSPAIRFISEEMYMMLQPQQIYVCVVLLLISPMRERESLRESEKTVGSKRGLCIYIQYTQRWRGRGIKISKCLFLISNVCHSSL